MSVTALNPQGRILAPHEFGATLADIHNDGHLRRFYSPRVLRALDPQPHELEFQELLSYELIRAACLRILETRASSVSLPRVALHVALDLSKVCTEHAQHLPGTTLIVADDLQAIKSSLAQNLEGVPSLRRLLRGSSKKATPDAKQAEKKNALEQQEDYMQGWVDAEDAGLLDLKYLINSKSHLARFGAPPGFSEKLYRSRLYLPEEVLQMSCEEQVEAALCGALYLGSSAVDLAYEATAQTLAERALESFVLGGRSLIYGLNLPFDRLIIACDGLSRAELTQLCGRVGRSCRSDTKAEIIFLSKKVAREALTADVPRSAARDAVKDIFKFE